MLPILRLLRAAAGSDRDLLDRYARGRDPEAFEALVRRYGPGVWAACVRLAGRDAEDAFQAVFLTLSRKSATVSGSLPAWLHAVTRRVASTLRRTARRRTSVETAAARPELVGSADPSLREGLALLDEELARLPEQYRAVLIVCCVEGRSRDEAAAQLGWTEGQVKGRLERAREMLRTRLARRGIELGGLLLAAAVAGPVPARAARPSAAAVALSHGVIRAMVIQKLTPAAVGLAACVAFAGGVVLHARPDDPPAAPPAGAAQDKAKAPPAGRADGTAQKELDDLRTRVETLERRLAAPAAAQPKVVVSSPRVKDVVVTRQYAGKVVAQHHVDVRAAAGGQVTEVLLRQGDAVKKGDVLFKVEPYLYRAKLDAELAELKIAQVEFDNTKHLFEQKVVSSKEVALQDARLAKARAKARLAEAELALTVGRAAIDGRVGPVKATVGDVVKAGDAITTLSDEGVMWAYFNVPEARYLEYKAGRDPAATPPPVELVLATGSKYAEGGKLAAVERWFVGDAGTVSARADFPNPKGLLCHGMSGTVLVRESLKGAVVIPRRAAFEDRDRWYVYVVGRDDVARRREVVVRAEFDDLFVVASGLDVSDRVVVEGVRQVRDGEKVEFELRRPGP